LFSQWFHQREKTIWKWFVQYGTRSYRVESSLSWIYNSGFYWGGGSMSYWHNQKVSQIAMKLLWYSLTMVILIWENSMKNNMKMCWEVLKTIIYIWVYSWCNLKLRILLGKRKHVILKYSKSKSVINEAALFWSNNGYTDMSKQIKMVVQCWRW